MTRPTHMSMDRKVQLQSSDGVQFEVDMSVVQYSKTLIDIIKVTGSKSTIPLQNISKNILAKVIEYCTYHQQFEGNTDEEPTATEDAIKQRDADFVKVDPATLVGLICAANYLNMKNLLDLTCQEAAGLIRDKAPTEIRTSFGIVNISDPQEEVETRSEIEWIYH